MNRLKEQKNNIFQHCKWGTGENSYSVPTLLFGIVGGIVYSISQLKNNGDSWCVLEQFLTECRKTKTKVITLANHKGHRQSVKQSKLESNTCRSRELKRGKMCTSESWLVVTSDWLRKWRECFQPITKRSNARWWDEAGYCFSSLIQYL